MPDGGKASEQRCEKLKLLGLSSIGSSRHLTVLCGIAAVSDTLQATSKVDKRGGREGNGMGIRMGQGGRLQRENRRNKDREVRSVCSSNVM
jgi:hypothetical protein